MASQPNRILAIVLGVIAVVAVVAGVLAANRHVATYDRGTPEGTVQAYLSAVVDGDNEKAIGLLAAESRCDIADLDRAYVPDDVRVVLRDTEVTGDTARVEVDVVMSSGDLFGGEYAEKHTVRLVKLGESWFITGDPWPMYECTKED